MAIEPIHVILDDKTLAPKQKKDLQSFLLEQPEVKSIGAFIKELHGTSHHGIETVSGIVATIVLVIPKGVRETAEEIAKKLVMKWVESRLPHKEKPAADYVTIYDHDGQPAVKVEKPPVRIAKR